MSVRSGGGAAALDEDDVAPAVVVAADALPDADGAESGLGVQVKAGGVLGEDAAALCKIFTIFEGTSEIQRLVIGRTITGLPVR